MDYFPSLLLLLLPQAIIILLSIDIQAKLILYIKTNRVPIKRQLVIIVTNNYKHIFTHICIKKVSILAFIQNFARATTNRERAPRIRDTGGVKWNYMVQLRFNYPLVVVARLSRRSGGTRLNRYAEFA